MTQRHSDTLYITYTINTFVFAIYTRKQIIVAIKLGSKLTIVYFVKSSTDSIMYYRGACHFTYNYDLCITKNRCMIDQTYL